MAVAAHHDGSVPIGEAKTTLSKIIARVEAGEEVVLRRGDKPVAKIVPLSPNETVVKNKIRGAFKDEIWMADDFDDIPPGFEDYV